MAARRAAIEEAEIRQMTTNAMVDTGAFTLVINEEIREKLGLDISGAGEGTLADGTKVECDMAGPIEIWWKNRRAVCEALVLPEAKDVLLGAYPLELMDLTINPNRELVGVHGDIVMHSI